MDSPKHDSEGFFVKCAVGIAFVVFGFFALCRLCGDRLEKMEKYIPRWMRMKRKRKKKKPITAAEDTTEHSGGMLG